MLPTSTPGALAPLTITTSNVLLLVSFNGKAMMSDFFDFYDLIQQKKSLQSFADGGFFCTHRPNCTVRQVNASSVA